jgi:fructan beta-fructosidase
MLAGSLLWLNAGVYPLLAETATAAGSVTGSVVNVFPDLGGLLAYEGFNYGQSGNDIDGANGGLGWADTWINVNGRASRSHSNDLVAGASAPAGYDSHSFAGSLFIVNSSRKGRFLDCSPTGPFAAHGYLDANGHIGADGKTIYLSFLQQPNGTSQFYEFELHRDDLGDGGRIGGIGNDTSDNNVHLRSESPPGGSSKFWDLGAGNTNVNFYVLRVDFKPGNDDVFVYRNPTSATEPPTATLTVSNVADISFDGIAFGAYLNGRTVSHDEVRLGMTWADVMGSTASRQQLAEHMSRASTNLPALSRTMWLTNDLLNLPVKNSAAMKRVTVTVGGKPVRDFNIKLANGAPNWWAFVDISEFSNQTATISVNRLSPGSTGLSSVMQSNGIVGATNLYQETLRPQIHFSSKRGWLNDANGMIYYHGLYHLYYQHDPFTWDGSGQKWWGHATSPDMVTWTEIREGLYSHTYGDDVWSGSTVVDSANTGGFKTGTNDVMVTAFYSTGRGECIAFSNDGGMSFSDYTYNPVAVHSGQGRDPHLFWYAPSNYWVMAVYDDAGGNGVQFYTTPDFRHWTFRSKIYNGFFECPDIFQLPVDGNTNHLMWVLNDASAGYQLGQFDGVTFKPSTAKLPGNEGSGYYASQTFTEMPPGDLRKVRMGWAMLAMRGMPFNQAMFFPTALTLNTTSNGVRLCSLPVAEITNLVVKSHGWTNLTLNPGDNPMSEIRGNQFHVQAQFNAATPAVINFSICGIPITYAASTRQISCNGHTRSLPPMNGAVLLEIISDRQIIEIFGNGGQLYMPIAGVGYSPTNHLISVTSAGGPTTFQHLKVNLLKSVW